MSITIVDNTFCPRPGNPVCSSASNTHLERAQDKIKIRPSFSLDQVKELKDRVEVREGPKEKFQNVEQDEYPWPEKITQFTDIPLEAYIPLEKPTPEKRAEIREFLRRVTHNDLKAFLISMRGVPELTIPERTALKNGDYDHPLFNNPLYPRLTLREFIAGRMDRWELSDILVHYECMQCPGAKAKLLLDLTEEECALYGLEKSDELKKLITVEVATGHLPVGRTYVYTLPIIPNGSILDRISDLRHTYLINKQEKKHMVLSPYLLGKSLKVIGSENIKPNPILGESRSSRNQKKIDCRDVLVPCCGIFPGSIPVEADGYSATPIEFYEHDALYHLYIESKISQVHRKAWIELANLRKAVDITLLDREFNSYTLPDLSDEVKFWQTLCNEIPKSTLLDIVLPHIFKYHEKWKNEYRIDINDFDKYIDALSGSNVYNIQFTIHGLKRKALLEHTRKSCSVM